ncbi:MAG: type 1 glutamine amidotransferase [Solirubrobacterales bacterium]
MTGHRAAHDAATLRVCALYPSRMNIYADRGNLMVLQERCARHGFNFQLTAVDDGDSIDPDAHDLYYIGGGQDSDQIQIADDIHRTKRESLVTAAESGKVILAVCGGYQLLGEYYELDDRRIDGLGIIDLRTVREPGPRLIGNVTIEVSVNGQPRELAGFENHGGRTYLGNECEPLGRVVSGYGNNGKDGFEGARSKNVFGTYLHGPLLPKNVWFADHLLTLALALDGDLPPLDDRLEDLAHQSALRASQKSHGLKSRLAKRVGAS